MGDDRMMITMTMMEGGRWRADDVMMADRRWTIDDDYEEGEGEQYQ